VSTAQPKQAEAPQDGDPSAKASMSVSARYGEALLWAEQLHRDQRRKGKAIPYISHLISVSALVWEDGGTEDHAIAALLHDAIEDARY
jgi:(p)ppGpp synthase/HD superfamily hydrolase